MKFQKIADGQTIFLKKDVYRSKAGKVDPGLIGLRNDSTGFL